MLSTHKPPDGRIMLVTDGVEHTAKKLSFNPLITWNADKCLFGLVEFQKRHTNLVGLTVDVWRGRHGKKLPEQLTVLHKMPSAMPNWPKPQYKGFLKAVTRSFEGLGSVLPNLGERAWVAIEFTQSGIVRRGVTSPIGENNLPAGAW